MICAVDLLPESCHNVRQRIRRRNVWVVVLTIAGLLLAGAWLILCVSDHVIGRSQRELEVLQARQSELNRQLTLATITRNRLAEQGRALSALRHEQPLPQQLLLLSEQAPSGVVFGEISTAAAPGPGRSSRPRSRSAQPAPVQTPATENQPTQPAQIVRMRGYAIDHNELTRLIDVLQHVPQWQQVELLRAAREPYGSTQALAFQIECRPAEDAP
jgi:hypothetical protein